ncbi:MAG: extracellular solute-binding protein [Chloroflexi bacterium]|nr:extracellular solute-binding protein [Chloroflexota bacterium]MCY3937794.1 extracellular solute-binding protein [Chloroflexota bacterium]
MAINTGQSREIERPAKSRRSRRRFVQSVVGLAGAAFLGGCDQSETSELTVQPTARSVATSPPRRIGLTLTGWPFRQDLLHVTLEAFRSQNPLIDVEFLEVLNDYRVRLDDLLVSPTPPNVVQVREGQAGAWWSRGLIRPLEEIPAFSDLAGRLRPAARAAIGPDGSIAGLPFYSDVMVLAYNRSMIDRIGGRPPDTWEELSYFGRELRDRRISTSPFSLNFSPKVNANLPWWAMLFASGGRLLSNDGSASGTDSAVRLLTILRRMFVEDLVIDPSVNVTTYSAITSGDHAFALVGTYTARRFADARDNLGGPDIGFATVPGLDGPGTGTVSWTPFYAIPAGAGEVESSALLALHLGGVDGRGEFFSSRFWAQSEGLPPAYPEVLQDARVKETFGSWIDLEFLDRVQSMGRPPDGIWQPWFETWEHWAQDEVLRALWGRSTPEDAVRAILESASALRAKFGSQ